MLDGIDLSSWCEELATNSYEERLKKGEESLWRFLENQYPEGERRDAVVIGVSKNDVSSHKKFEKKYDLPFSNLMSSCCQLFADTVIPA